MDLGPRRIGAVTVFIRSGSASQETRWASAVGYAGRAFLLAALLVVPQALDDVTTGGAGGYNTACRAALTSWVMVTSAPISQKYSVKEQIVVDRSGDGEVMVDAGCIFSCTACRAAFTSRVMKLRHLSPITVS